MRNTLAGDNIGGPDSFRFTIDYATPVAPGVMAFHLPPGTILMQSISMTTEDWDAAPPYVNFGLTPGSYDFGAPSISASISGGTQVSNFGGSAFPAGGAMLYVNLTDGGGAPTKGSATFVIQFDRP